MKKELWCVHFIGPDDLYAAPSKEAAEERVLAHKELINSEPKMRDFGLQVEVQLWPWTPEAHAESLQQWGELFPQGHNV